LLYNVVQFQHIVVQVHDTNSLTSAVPFFYCRLKILSFRIPRKRKPPAPKLPQQRKDGHARHFALRPKYWELRCVICQEQTNTQRDCRGCLDSISSCLFFGVHKRDEAPVLVFMHANSVHSIYSRGGVFGCRKNEPRHGVATDSTASTSLARTLFSLRIPAVSALSK